MVSNGQTSLFCNLKILSQVRQNDRVSSRRDVLDISRTSVASCRRWWYGESRAHNISTIAAVLEVAFHNVRLYIEKRDPTPQDRQTIDRLDRELRGLDKASPICSRPTTKTASQRPRSCACSRMSTSGSGHSRRTSAPEAND